MGRDQGEEERAACPAKDVGPSGISRARARVLPIGSDEEVAGAIIIKVGNPCDADAKLSVELAVGRFEHMKKRARRAGKNVSSAGVQPRRRIFKWRSDRDIADAIAIHAA